MTPAGDIMLDRVTAARMQDTSTAGGDVLIWTVTAWPSDYPDKFAARPFSARTGAPFPAVLLAGTLDALRDLLPSGLTLLRRDASDDPVIVESWI
jgi:hypothetical protein